ncbi:helix-turn-helix transcriptional regulator [Pseudonocardia bannensis]|uniref:Helix-turn-helix transcriptional regulator n=2 Tax=Pseudonocardia bannensis TaxID=630973 RepID=A0A848DQZ6_9PSEU|nr:helix-turn-helix transcriptional regulator [Pseudonocardia bannensis]
MTEQELAERVGSPVDTIREIERNDREPNLDMLFRLAAALGVTPSDLLVGGERPLISADEPRTALAISGSVLR